jgi:hypothetical protein
MPKVVLIDKRQLPVGAITHNLGTLIKKALNITIQHYEMKQNVMIFPLL